jgi:hypothetical protein
MMKMKKIVLCLLAFIISANLIAQDTKEVEVKGTGVRKDDALQDALRNAISEAIGVSLVSETKVENFMVIQDAIQTRTQGYISSYNIIKETPLANRFEIIVRAQVSLNPIKADINYLSQALGGIRFLVMYDDRNVPENERENYESAIERINGFLSERKYRYVDRTRFNALKKESMNIKRELGGFQEEGYIQHLGMMADAQFIIYIKKISVTSRSEAFDTRTSSRVVIEAKAYDNCTAEGLGTVTLESDWKNARDAQSTIMAGITEAVNKDFTKLTTIFNSYIGEWINNGTPFELRFYSSGTFRDLRDLRNKLKDDKNFGGQLEMVALDNFTKMNCTFRKKPDVLADKVLDYSDEVPTLKDKRMDVKFIYGRQISFAPTNVTIPDMPKQQPNTEPAVEPKPEPAKNPTPATNTAKKPTKTPAKKPATTTTKKTTTTTTPKK